MNPTEQYIFDGRTINLTWIASETYPQDIPISQVSGFCTDDAGRVLLVKNKRGWAFPGGHPEAGESPEETLVREVKEEANVSLDSHRLIGYMDVSDPDNESIEGKHYIQLRYLARIGAMNDFEKEFETTERKMATLDELPNDISWISSPTGQGQLETLKKEMSS